MKISYNWLQCYLDALPAMEQLSDILTSIGLEVDGAVKSEGGLQGVVVGEVLTCEDHPDSDHLHVTTVDVGGEVLQIVCGASNVAANQKVFVATVGTVLPGDFKIKKSKIRGVESHGMICAEDELGIGEGHEGIMVLDGSAVAGMSMADYLGVRDDYTIEIGLTPNRVDAASHIGVARDVAAYLRAPESVRWPDVDGFSPDGTASVPIEVVDRQGAPRYAGVTISGLRGGPSPEWMVRRLEAIGLNSHGVLVDITNFVLHELGQPLHAFDADKISDKIVVRSGLEGSFVTLDGVERRLSGEDVMICDGHRPLCIAGVMGGADSGVSEGTTRIFLESACFDPVRVRKTARRLGINSDASFLFERGVDPDMAVYALKRAALLYKELAGGEVSAVEDIYPDPVPPHRFEFSLSRANRLIGKEIGRETVLEILAALGVTVERDGGDVLSVAVPPYRVDVVREADLVEEVLRIYGYNNVEIPVGLKSALSSAPRPDRERLQGAASDFLTSNGFVETMSNSLTRGGYYGDEPSLVRILNPLSSDLDVMRQTLLYGMLEAVRLNTNHKNPDLKLYEFGNCYFHTSEGYEERSKLAILVTGLDVPASWDSKGAVSDFYSISGIVERLCGRFGVKAGDFIEMQSVSGDVLRRFDLKAPVWFAELDFGRFVELAGRVKIRAQELPRFPSVRRDLALVIDRGVTFATLRQIAFKTEKKLLRDVALFDVYEGDKIPAGKKSYALGFTLQDREATLTDKTIEGVMANLVRAFEREAGATLRELRVEN